MKLPRCLDLHSDLGRPAAQSANQVGLTKPTNAGIRGARHHKTTGKSMVFQSHCPEITGRFQSGSLKTKPWHGISQLDKRKPVYRSQTQILG